MRRDPPLPTAKSVADSSTTGPVTHRTGRSTIRAASLLALAAALSGCGGDDGSRPGSVVVAPTPSPSPTPTPAPTPTPTPPAIGAATDPIIFAADQSQIFASEGYYARTIGGIEVQFDRASKTYWLTNPADTTATPLRRASNYLPAAGAPWLNFAFYDNGYLYIRASGTSPDPEFRYLYSNLAAWGVPQKDAFDFSGHTAFGIPTPANALPRQGTVTYSGFIEGSATEKFNYPAWGDYYGGIAGSITLTIDFTAGTATIAASPMLELATTYPLAAITGNLPLPGNRPSGLPTLSYQFTGPTGEELIGGLQLEYLSPVDGTRQSAGAAFIAKRTN